MKIERAKLGKVFDVFNELKEIAFNFNRSVEIARFISNVLNVELQNFEQKRIEVCQKFVIVDEQGNPVLEDGKFKMSETAQKSFNDEMTIILNEVIDLPFDNLFTEGEFMKLQIKPSVILELSELKLLI